MSLTSHLNNRHSAISRFFTERFANTRSVTRECAALLSGTTTLRPSAPVPWSTLGTAIDYRIRYYFAITPYENLIAWRGAQRVSDSLIWTAAEWDKETGEEEAWVGRQASADSPSLPLGTIESFFAELGELLQHHDPVRRRLDRPQEEQISRFCVVLALFEEIFRAGVNINSALFLGEAKLTVQDLLSITEPHWVDDLCSLSWLFHEHMGNKLANPCILNPTFEGSHDVGGADADLILDGCLIDIKATVNPRVANLWLYQLLGYVLLDYGGQYRIDEVGIYLARQGVLLKWPLQELLNRLSGDLTTSLDELRDDFHKVAQ